MFAVLHAVVATTLPSPFGFAIRCEARLVAHLVTPPLWRIEGKKTSRNGMVFPYHSRTGWEYHFRGNRQWEPLRSRQAIPILFLELDDPAANADGHCLGAIACPQLLHD